MKSRLKFSGVAASAMLALSLFLPLQAASQGTQCVDHVTLGSNPNCRNGNSASAVNECSTNADIRICIWTTKDRWDCGVSWAVAPGQRWSWPSCFGTNKVFYSSKPSGSNRPLERPEE
jgi:hypothetical protein